jgi:glycosyltransferase involved in cell wall biosynthesis
MNILNIIDIPWNSGLAAYAFEQSSALAERGHGIFFAAPENSASAAFARAKAFPLTAIPGRRDPFILGALFKLKELIETRGIDVVNAHTGRAQTMAWLLARISSRRTVLIRTKADAKRPSPGFTLGKTALIIAGSEYIKEMYLRAGLSPGRVETIYQGITPPPSEVKIPAAPLKIGILGRLDPVKGHLCFLDAAALVLKKFPTAEFLVAGGEETTKFAELERRAGELGIAAAVKLLGHVRDAAAFNISCDAGVIASLGSEAVSRAAFEWLAAGRPLVATSVGCLPELVGPEWLIPPKDPVMMADKLISLLESPERRLKVGAGNRNRILKEFSPEVFAARTENLFKKVSGGRN